ncbi:hypothetical protein QUC31_013847 [Theobroma cacao]
MLIKPPFSLILCCFLLASLLFIRHGVVARRLQEVQENDNGKSKVGITRSKPTTAPSWVGQNNPPIAQSASVKRSWATSRFATYRQLGPFRGALPSNGTVRGSQVYNRCRRIP